MELEVFCSTEDCRVFLGESSHSFSLGSCKDLGWLLVAQAAEPLLWGLGQFLLSATVSGSLDIPLLTSFPMSGLGALVPLTDDLHGNEGQEGRDKSGHLVTLQTILLTVQISSIAKPTDED